MNRKSFTEQFESQLEAWSAELEALEAEVKRAGSAGESASQRELEELREVRREARARLEEIRGAADGSWEHLTDEVERAFTRLRSAVEAARKAIR